MMGFLFQEMFRYVIITAAVLGCCHAVPDNSLEGFSVIRATPKTANQLHALALLTESGIFDFWMSTSQVDHPADIMVSPKNARNLILHLKKDGIPFKIIIHNVQSLVDEERKLMDGKNPLAGPISFESYNSHIDINSYLEDMASANPSICSVINIGKSYENRDMKVIKIGSNENTPKFWIDGGIHAREWIAPATVLWFINQLISGYESDPSIRRLVDSITWYILPVHNPDGYEYTRQFGGNRMWRKTRSANAGTTCLGTDPNRNFNYSWGGLGVSWNPCSDTYPGASAESEVEVRNAVRFLEREGQFSVHLAFHAYGQMILLPYADQYNHVPDDFDDMMALAGASAEALTAVHGTAYRYNTVPNLIYPTSGSVADYMKGVLRIKWSYGWELRDTGRYGFLLPPSLIVETASETWEAVKVIAEKVITG